MCSWNQCYCGKAIIILFSHCLFLALCLQHRIRMRHIFNMASSSVQYFWHYVVNSTLSEKIVIEHNTCIWIFWTNLFRSISYSKQNSEIFDKNVYKSSCELDVVLVSFYWILNFLNRFWIKFYKNSPVCGRFVPSERTGIHEETNCSFSKFFERCLKSRKYQSLNCKTEISIFKLIFY